MRKNERKYFQRNAIEEMLEKIAHALEKEINVVLIGGGAMSLKGNKEVTKDVDVAVIDSTERDEFCRTILKLGFRSKDNLSTPYKKMNAGIFVNSEGFQIDLFPETVCKRFIIHSGIVERAMHYRDYERMRVFLLSDEDIFLSKSVTERERDLDDMFVLYKKGLNEEIIISEMMYQTAASDTTLWGAFLTRKLYELEERYNITIPWKEKVEKIAVMEMETMLRREESHG